MTEPLLGQPLGLPTDFEGHDSFLSARREAGEENPYSWASEVRYFFMKGVPLCLSAILEWGLPPLFAMFFAGHTESSADLQAALGYGRVFYNCTLLMNLLGACSYFFSVIPGCIGAGRQDRIPQYLKRSLLLSLMFLTPLLILQFWAGSILHVVGVSSQISSEVVIYCRWMVVTTVLLLLEIHLECTIINLGNCRSSRKKKQKPPNALVIIG